MNLLTDACVSQGIDNVKQMASKLKEQLSCEFHQFIDEAKRSVVEIKVEREGSTPLAFRAVKEKVAPEKRPKKIKQKPFEGKRNKLQLWVLKYKNKIKKNLADKKRADKLALKEALKSTEYIV